METALNEYAGPGQATLVTEYRPSGTQAPVDVPEIAGLIVKDADGIVHHLRLYRDESAAFIEIPDDPGAKIRIDPMKPNGGDDRYEREAPPRAVLEILDTLEVTPTWENTCADGDHDFSIKHEGTPYEVVKCDQCHHGQAVLTWLGHHVSVEEETEQ